MEKKYSIFHIEGGLGKHVAATAVAQCIKSNHSERELVVVCAYPELFLGLDFVDKVYRIGNTPYFYETYIKDVDSLIFKHEPYFTTEHIHKKLPLIENWCKLYQLEYNGETPILRFNRKQKQIGLNKWERERPIMVIQTNGGPLQEQPYNHSWTRDMPQELAQSLVNHYQNDYHIIQICRNENQILQGVEAHWGTMSNMELFSLLLVSEKQILIDSCLQHASAALGKSSTVLWVGTSPTTFGYELHSNIIAKLPQGYKLPDSYLFDYNFTGTAHECPIMEGDILFDINEIISSLTEHQDSFVNPYEINLPKLSLE